MKNLILSMLGITVIGGIVLSLMAGTWIMLGASLIFMGGSLLISYIGGWMTQINGSDDDIREKNGCYRNLYSK